MQKITHLWNVNQFITKLNCSQTKNLQTFYIKKCRTLGEGMQLPYQNFSPSVMCPYCGSLWETVDYTIRISRGKELSKSMKKVACSMNNNNKRIPKVRRKLVEKCLKNKMNKLIIKCSVCSKSTKMAFNKPQREKIQKTSSEGVQSCQKRKKKRTKDRTAGLNISGTVNSNTENISGGLKKVNTKRVRNTTNFIKSTQKLKLNINRLKDYVNKVATPPKRNSLQSFLSELC
ncbi:hypothetical protein WH47_03028 [Habropoda laboriosa]|uniref:Uncharacterized protein n=1 Tax=Habropoda laboriosa TaxID=597456 RepID=A0A0L7QTG4_9HYME|nr:PREDICTED: uncharacterized protein LOC108575615 [Habropoda laboriosa]KOC61771.1 hypothetical protein WH47_03028 [Habropoda laboriosa]